MISKFPGEQELPVIYDTGSFEDGRCILQTVASVQNSSQLQVLVLSTKCNTCVKTLSM